MMAGWGEFGGREDLEEGTEQDRTCLITNPILLRFILVASLD